ncbi:SDR family oxidoreductase [Pedobacter sp. MC2016-24]|uniref:SDR family oxidoreductase n=1 Tax=Pedobacter sp. MC2016-24 TaxID=2780090 RepID=UPI00187E2712|nr:SDR family oxidoreductase [Pedobacter sp. MC2016-24]MBE9601587.1 SDR family oxidoreductase [Pedobacter sp. MC2016-24]
MILVTGASGHLGKATIDSLLKKVPAKQVVALVRDKNKADNLKAKGVQVRVGDYTDPSSIISALEGIEDLLLVSSSSLDRLQDHKNVIDAAKEKGLKHIYYTSGAVSNYGTTPLMPLAASHGDTEAYIKSSGLTYTIFQNSMYAETIPMYVGEKAVDTGIYFPAEDGKAAFALRTDMAEAIANAITSDGHENKTYVITGSKAYSFADVAEVLSELAGKQVTYISPEPADYEATLKKYNVPEDGIFILSLFAETFRHHDLEQIDPAMENLLGRKPTDLRTYLKSAYFSN